MSDSSTHEVGHSTFRRDGMIVKYWGQRETVSFEEGKSADAATGIAATDLESQVEDV